MTHPTCLCGESRAVSLSSFDGSPPLVMCARCRARWKRVVLAELIENGHPFYVEGRMVLAEQVAAMLRGRAEAV